ncbi:MAG: radical SAM protein [Candidatus Abyssubacteria bacterium]
MGRALESGTLLGSFDIIAFSVAFELDYPNVIKSLLAARLPTRSEQRDESHPLIIAGGPCIFSNPEPLAPFIDLCAIGEGEELVNEIVNVHSDCRSRGMKREDELRALAEIPGVYVPSLYSPAYSDDGELEEMRRKTFNAPGLPVHGRIVKNLDEYPCASAIVTPHTEFADMFLVEVGRGCRRGCKFCSACYTYLRRVRSPDSLKEQIMKAREEGLAEKVGLVTSDLSDYPHHSELLAFLVNKGLGFSVSSIRADAITDALLAGMRKSGQRTLTLAPEVAVEHLQALTGKRITSDMLLKAVDMALEQGITNFRLYFMIGFPGEEDDDVQAIVELAARVSERMRNAAKRLQKVGKLTISVNPFVPKPFTPLEAAPFAKTTVLTRRMAILRRGLARIPNTGLVAESSRMARLQCAFARGDRRTGGLAELLASGSTVTQAMKAFEKMIERSLALQPKGGISPWHVIEPPSFWRLRMKRKAV